MQKKVGTDRYGNKYFTKNSASPKNNFRTRRFVVYKGMVEASKIPQEWNAWLHHVSDEVPNQNDKRPVWSKEHTPNLTGTPYAYEYKDKKDTTKIKNVISIWKPK